MERPRLARCTTQRRPRNLATRLLAEGGAPRVHYTVQPQIHRRWAQDRTRGSSIRHPHLDRTVLYHTVLKGAEGFISSRAADCSERESFLSSPPRARRPASAREQASSKIHPHSLSSNHRPTSHPHRTAFVSPRTPLCRTAVIHPNTTLLYSIAPSPVFLLFTVNSPPLPCQTAHAVTPSTTSHSYALPRVRVRAESASPPPPWSVGSRYRAEPRSRAEEPSRARQPWCRQPRRRRERPSYLPAFPVCAPPR